MMVTDSRVMPHDLDAEEGVLGCILIDNGLMDKAQQFFGDKEIFYARKNRVVYAAMQALHRESLPIDLVNLHYRLKNSDNVDALYLTSLEETVPHSLSFDYYTGELLTLFHRRQRIEAGTRIVEAAYGGVDAGATTIVQLLENQSADTRGIIRPMDIEGELRELHKDGGLKRGASTGWPCVDSYYTVSPGLLTVITGIPSHGKSTWLTNLLVNLATRHGWKFAIFSPENMPVKRYIAQIISTYVGKPFGHITEGEFEYALDWVQNHFGFLASSDFDTVDNLIGKARICIEKHGISGFAIDPWNEVDHSRPDGLTETEYVSGCLSKLKRLAQTQQIHIWLVAHPMKLQKRTDGTYGVPTPYDISGSAHFRNKADICLCVWRDLLADNGLTELHVQKIRFREVGRVGMVSLNFNLHTGRYE